MKHPSSQIQREHAPCEEYLPLVGGGTNPSEKYARQIGSSPQG